MTNVNEGYSRSIISARILITGESGQIRGLWQQTNMMPHGIVVIAPGFGSQQRRGQSIALYFLLNGYDVVRFDPTNHVGASDGMMRDFTLRTLVKDIATVIREISARTELPILMFATSMAARAFAAAISGAYGAIVSRTCLKGIGLISPVIDLRDSIIRADGDDLIARWVNGEIKDPSKSAEVLDHDVCWRFVEDLVSEQLETGAAGLRDYGNIAPIPTSVVAGGRDDWVDTEQIHQLAQFESMNTLILSDCAHALNPASARIAMRFILDHFAALTDNQHDSGIWYAPRITHVIGMSKNEAVYWHESRVGEAPPNYVISDQLDVLKVSSSEPDT